MKKKNIKKLVIILGVLVLIVVAFHLFGPYLFDFVKEMHGMN